MAFEFIPFTPGRTDEWNAFVAQSKNATFLHDRRYMDYHADRFADASLMVCDAKGIFALLPANRVGQTLYSHQGLTYGGLLLGSRATADAVCQAMTDINNYLRKQGVSSVVCKTLPWIYTAIPSDEPLYAFTEVCHATLKSRDIASVINLNHQVAFSELRRRGKKKAEHDGIRVAFSDDFPSFWQILTENLKVKYDSCPVHSLQEITLLRDRFPENIRLYAAFEGEQMVAGTVLYVTPRVVKTQYISASLRGKEVGALDLLFASLLSTPAPSFDYLDLGTSALEHSTALKLPLIFQKEGFGARAVCYDTYEWNL